MDFGAAFSFVTEDEDWLKKLGIAAGLALAGIITFGLALIPLAGWSLAITRRVSEETQPLLPEWDRFGEFAMDGLKMIGIGLIWSLPIILLGACVGLVSALVSSGQGNGEMISTVLSSLVSCITIPYAIVIALLEPAAFGHLAHTDNFGQALNPGNAFKIFRENIGGFVITAVVWLLLVPIINSIGTLICGIGLFVAMAYSAALMGHLMGQAYKGSLDAGLDLTPAV